MEALLKLTVAGNNTGPFELYSDVDGFHNPFETGVLKDDLVSGYLTATIPDYTTIVRVENDTTVSICSNFYRHCVARNNHNNHNSTITMALIEITLTIDGQAGPFDLFSDVDNYVSAFDTQVPATAKAGYIVEAPDGTTMSRFVLQVFVKLYYITNKLSYYTTTTSSSTSTSTTSTSTSTTSSTTTINKLNWELITNTPSS